MIEAPTPGNAALPSIAGYRLQSRLGTGGMADVYLAEQMSLTRQVAIKVLGNRPNQSSDLSVRFEREARTIARLEHPDIVGIHDVGRTADGHLYYAMPYLPNGDLSKRDLRGRPQQLVAVLRRICNALEYAHAQGVVHRDVKPENILFDASDNARLTDFGIAISSEHDQRVTAEGRTLGSSGYMSPEQARGMRLDGRADLYSLGVVLFEMLTGDVPYHGSDSLAVALAHTQDPIPQLGPGLRNWQPVIEQALAKQPAQRFQSAREMLQAIEDAAQTESTVNTREIAAAAHHDRAPTGSPLALGLAVALLIGAIGWLSWTLVPRFLESETPIFFSPAPVAAAQAPVAPVQDEVIPPLVVASGAALPVAERERLLAEALGLIQQGRLFEPDIANAAARLRTLAADTPDDPAVLTAVEQLLSAVSVRIDQSTAKGNWTAAAEDYTAAGGFAEATRTRAAASWRKLDAELSERVRTPLAAALVAEDKDALPPLTEIVAAIGTRHADLKRLYDQVAALPEAGAPMRDTGGPPLVYVPARIGDSQVERGFAMMRSEVSVGEFDAFVRATSRRPARCREGGLRAMLSRQDWRSPGFSQDTRHPAVCVSHDDAVAFANWLSARVHARYRLPTSSEWKHAAATYVASDSECAAGNVLDSGSLAGSLAGALRTETARNAHPCTDGARYTAPVGAFAATSIGLRDIAGNASEWTSDCADQGDKCARYVALGRSFRSGLDDSVLTTPTVQSSSAGAPWIGFRLVREVGVR